MPKGYPAESLARLADHVLAVPKASYGWRDLRAIRALRKKLRAHGFEIIVVMFPSVKLRLFALATGIRQRFCYTVDGRFEPLRGTGLTLIAGAFYRNIRGRLLYAYIRHIVYHRPVEPKQK